MAPLKVETALDWFNRSQRRRAAAETPTDPSSGAWAFVRSGSSGLAHVDAAWRIPSVNTNLPVVNIYGSVGKTWTLISLAARFVVATRPSRFSTSMEDLKQSTQELPQVVILDSTYDITIHKVAQVVRSTMLRQSDINAFSLEDEMDDCLGRIHVATVDDMFGWVPVLECLRCKLKGQDTHPTLILWDGFLSESDNESCQMEVKRQVSRLLQDCTVAMVMTTSNAGKVNWSNTHRDIHRIKLERRSGKNCFAKVNGSTISFSLSLGGILS